MLKRLRLKFICVNMVIVCVMLCVILGLTLYTTQQDLKDECVRIMEKNAPNPGNAPDHKNDRPDPNDAHLPCFTLSKNHDGKLVASGTFYLDLTDETLLQQLWDIAQTSSESMGEIDAYTLRFSKTESRGKTSIVFADISSEKSTMVDLAKNCVLIGLLVFLCFLPVSILLAKWAVKPVEEAWQQQRQFVADASHELKTPLTVITTNAELLQSPDYGSEAKQQFSQSILLMAQETRHLVEGLLELARVDSGTVKTAFQPLDLSQLAEQATLPFEAVFFEKELPLDTQIEENIWVKGSPIHLTQALEILLDNAQKYSVPPGSVTVGLHRQGKHCLLSVESPGDPISKSDLRNIFKRFYRIDPARSRTGSYGLGLSIAQGIITSHGGRIWAESTDGKNLFCILLPILAV